MIHVDLAQSYMVGDKLIDLECGWNAGVKKIHPRPHRLRRRTGAKASRKVARAAIVDHLPATADWILAQK